MKHLNDLLLFRVGEFLNVDYQQQKQVFQKLAFLLSQELMQHCIQISHLSLIFMTELQLLQFVFF